VRRGLASQRQERHLEQQTRLRVVAFSAWAVERGWPLVEAADFLGLCPRTLRHWRQHLAGGPVPLQVLGRRVQRSSPQQRNEVIDLLTLLGPQTSLATLQDCFAAMARAELHNLLVRYRRVWRMRYPESIHVLHWMTPGVVWAIDFTEPPQPIDGLYPYVLAVRDLASGQMLLWQPLVEATAATTCQALAYLFALQGAPLVLKMDNGSAFAAGGTLALLASAEVIALFSPPYVPRYNGAIEAGIGALKARTEAEACRQGHAGYWTMADVAAAQEQANTTARPRGPGRATPEEVWRQRQPVTSRMRALFQAAVTKHRREVRREEGHDEEEKWAEQEARRIDRKAISRALGECGHLEYRRRRIHLTIRGRKAATIT
jgi:transposase InsO family protein